MRIVLLLLMLSLALPLTAQEQLKRDTLQHHQLTLNQKISQVVESTDTSGFSHIMEQWLVEITADPKFQVDESLTIDCVWVSQHDYFSNWTSQKINPYDLDGAKFKDTLMVHINDSLANINWTLPVTNTRITSPFGFRRYRWHYGTDLKVFYGDPIVAAFDGIVRIVDYERYGYGRYVVLRHLNGLETLYGHMSKTELTVGDQVKAGDEIGLGGSTGRSTGTHLHFEIRYQGNAIDPSSIYDFAEDCLVEDVYAITPSSFQYLAYARKIRYHKIRRGDTLGHISLRYGVSVSRLCRLNGISRNTTLRIGRTLQIN
jgi:murein DD-endopeptidase MepM/ murein hydrolase activator NlpD